MNRSQRIAMLSLAAALVLAGCGKKEEAPAPVTAESAPAVPAAPAAPAVTADTTEADGLIAKAQTLINEKNYTAATDVIKQLSALKLTPEQQKIVDDLKVLVQKNLAASATDEAGKAVGGLLGK